MRYPRATLLLAATIVLVLGLAGLGVEGKLRPSSLDVPGTSSARAEQLLSEHFGPSAPFVILLRGPATALDRQGPELVRELRRSAGATTLSPWDRGSLARLRPGPRRALVLVDFRVEPEAAVREAVPELERAIAAVVEPPVRATQTGLATLSKAIQDESVNSTRRAELIALPVLLVVLLLVFRSPLAAAIPLAFGAASVLTTRGLLALAAPHVKIDGFALTVASMMGLALGVDYALLMVSRFREEVAAGRSPRAAAARTRRTAGRTTAFAGSTLVVAMAVTLWVMPGTLFLSLAGTAILVTVASVAIAALVAPAALLVAAPHLDRWRVGGGREGARLLGAVSAVLRRPRLTAAAIGALLVALALPVAFLKTGPPSVEQLPGSSPARVDTEAIGEAIGEGWDAPFVLVAASESGPITERSRLDSLRRLQRRIAADPGVQAVVGPGQIEHRVAPLRRQGRELMSGEGATSPARLGRLGDRLGDASSGLGRLRGGVGEAAAGADLLASGSSRAGEGAARISGGIDRAIAAAAEAVGALDRIDVGSGRLAAGQRRAVLGARTVRDELAGLMPLLRQGGLARARSLRDGLRRAAATDPGLAPLLAEAELLVGALADSRNQANRARTLAGRLVEGQARLADGGAELHEGPRPWPRRRRHCRAGSGACATGRWSWRGASSASAEAPTPSPATSPRAPSGRGRCRRACAGRASA